jgi:hypothetical protein
MKKEWISLMTGAVLLQSAYAQTTEVATAQASPASGEPAAEEAAGVVPRLSPEVLEVMRLAESGASDDTVLAYIKNVRSHFELSAETILYLKDLGLAPELITTMLDQDREFGASANDHTTATRAVPTADSASADPSAPDGNSEANASTYASNPPVEVNYFYNQLSPYGSWASVEGVGWCWQPHCSVLSHGWRPYCHGGHWVYTDCGWYWQSDYSWGWAPFHYGRWHHHERCGWVWCPDREWAPAWVTWRVTGDHCGWAPLPPNSSCAIGSGWRHKGIYYKDGCDFGLRPDHFTFVEMNHFSSREVAKHQLTPTKVQTIFPRTVVRNGTMNPTDRVFVNQGVPVEQVAAVTHTEIHKLAIRNVPAGTGQMNVSRAPHSTEPAVLRHELRPPPQSLNVVAQRVDEQHQIVLHTPVTPNGIQYRGQPQQAKGSTMPTGTRHPPQTEAPRNPQRPPGTRSF